MSCGCAAFCVCAPYVIIISLVSLLKISLDGRNPLSYPLTLFSLSLWFISPTLFYSLETLSFDSVEKIWVTQALWFKNQCILRHICLCLNIFPDCMPVVVSPLSSASDIIQERSTRRRGGGLPGSRLDGPVKSFPPSLLKAMFLGAGGRNSTFPSTPPNMGCQPPAPLPWALLGCHE